MKKMKLPGDNISLKTRKNENPLVMSWLNSQTNLMDSLRYLVEQEIATNGVRNLQTCVPVERRELSEADIGQPLNDQRHSTAWREASTAQFAPTGSEPNEAQWELSTASMAREASAQRQTEDRSAGEAAELRRSGEALSGEQADAIRRQMGSEAGEAAIMRYLAMSGASDEAIQAAFIAARQLAASAASESTASEAVEEEELNDEDIEAWS